MRFSKNSTCSSAMTAAGANGDGNQMRMRIPTCLMNGAVAWSLMKAVCICVGHDHVDKSNGPETNANLSYSIHESQHLPYLTTSRFVHGTASEYTDKCIVFPRRHVGNL